MEKEKEIQEGKVRKIMFSEVGIIVSIVTLVVSIITPFFLIKQDIVVIKKDIEIIQSNHEAHMQAALESIANTREELTLTNKRVEILTEKLVENQTLLKVHLGIK